MNSLSLAKLTLRAVLAERGMHVKDLAAVCGCSVRHVYNVVTDPRRSRKTVKKIEDYIGFAIFSAPRSRVHAATGTSGMKVFVSTVEAPSFAKRFELLQKIDPKGELSVSDIVRALGAAGDESSLAAIQDGVKPGASE